MKFIKSILSEMGWGGEGDMKLHALAGIFSLIAITPFFISHSFFAFPLSIRIFYAILCFLISLILIIRLNYWTFVIVAWLFRANLCEEDASFAFQSVTKFFFRRVRAWWEKKIGRVRKHRWEIAEIEPIEKVETRFASHISRDLRRPWIAREINCRPDTPSTF